MKWRRGMVALLAGLSTGLLVAPAPAQQRVETGAGAVLRGIDKINAEVSDLELANGEAAKFGRLTVRLRECRYPAEDPAGDAFAFLVIYEGDAGQPVFSGWMIASSPSLNAMEHPRYDIWVLRCKTG